MFTNNVNDDKESNSKREQFHRILPFAKFTAFVSLEIIMNYNNRKQRMIWLNFNSYFITKTAKIDETLMNFYGC